MHSKKFPEYNEKELMEWVTIIYKKGKAIRWIAEKLEMSYSSVRRVLINNQVILRQKEEVTIGNRRTCRICKKEKPLDKFVKDKTKSKGYAYICKICKRKEDRTK